MNQKRLNVRIADNVNRLRKIREWSQKQLAKEANITTATLSRLANGREHMPSSKVLLALSNALGVDIGRLFDDLSDDRPDLLQLYPIWKMIEDLRPDRFNLLRRIVVRFAKAEGVVNEG